MVLLKVLRHIEIGHTTNPPEGYRADYSGYAAITPDETFEAIDWAFSNNIQVITHSNGEAASDLFLAAIKTAKEKHPTKALRPVLIHGQFLRKDQIATVDELDIFTSLFPMHTFYWGDWHRDRTIGPVNAEHISPTGWIRERGTLEVGKVADFVVLSADPTAVNPESLDQLHVEQIIKGGKIIYEKPNN